MIPLTNPGGSSGRLQYNNSGVFGGAAALVYATSGTHLTVTAAAATDVLAGFVAHASQSANMTEWRSSGGTVGACVTSARAFSNAGGQTSAEVFGAGASVGGTLSTAFGNGASAASTHGLAIGASASASTTETTAIGSGATASDGGNSNEAGAVAIGRAASCVGKSVAIGRGATVTATSGVAIGHGVSVGGGAVGIGISITGGSNSVTIGLQANGSGGNSVAVGRGSSSASGGVALGYQSVTSAAGDFAVKAQTGGSVGGLKFKLQGNSSTSTRDLAQAIAEWVVSTDASRTGRLKLMAEDSGGSREGLRLEASGTAAMIGFLGATASARQTGGENVTNNVTAGGTTGTIADYSDLTTYANDAAAIRNNLYQLARLVKQDHDALRLYGLLT